MGQQADGFLGDLETALSQATGGVGGLGDTGTTPLPSLPSLLGGLPFQPRSDLDWIFRSLLGSAFTLPRRPIPPEMRRRMQALEDALSQSIIPLATGLVNLMGDTLDTLSQKSISDLAAITRAAQDELQIVDALRRIEQPFFAVLADLVRYFGDSLDAEIDVPLLSEFYELVVGDQPTLLDALCLVLAAQTAAVFTVTTGRTEIEFLKDRRTMDWLLSASFADLVGAGAAHSREAAAIPPGAMAFLTLALQIVYSGCYALAIIPGVALDLADDKTGAQTRLELLAISGALSTVAIAVSCPAYFSGGTNLRSRVNRMELAYWGFQSWFLAVPMLATAEASAGKKWQQLFQVLGGGCEFFGSFVSLGLAIALAVYEDQEQANKRPIALETSQNCLGAVMQLLAPVRPVIAKKPEALAALYVLSYGGVATLNLTRALQAFSNAPHQRDA